MSRCPHPSWSPPLGLMIMFNMKSLTTKIKRINKSLVSWRHWLWCHFGVEMRRGGEGKWQGVGTSRNWQSIPGRPSWNIKFTNFFWLFLSVKFYDVFHVLCRQEILHCGPAPVSNWGGFLLKRWIYLMLILQLLMQKSVSLGKVE